MNRISATVGKYKFELIFFIFIFFIVLAVYSQCFNFNFVFFDDDLLILNKVPHMENISAAKDMFFTPVLDGITDGYYRPVLMLSYLADTLICGGEPGFYHYSSVMLHILAAFLVFIFFGVLGYSKKISAAAAVIFAVHPALTAAVAWIPGRNDILLTVFSLLSFIFFVQSVKSGKLSKSVLSAFFLLAALLTKETATVLPAIYILYVLLYKINAGKVKVLKISACIISALAVYAALRGYALPSGAKSTAVPEILFNIAVSIKATVWYPAVILLTEKVLIFPETSNLTYARGCFSVIIIIALCIFFRKHCSFKNILFGFAWFMAFLIPTYATADNNFFTHRLYLPMPGFFIIIFEILKSAAAKYPKIKNTLFAVFVIITLLMSFLSYKQASFYSDRKTFWSKALEENRLSPHINLMVSAYYRDSGRADKAEEHALAALKNAKKAYMPAALTEVAMVYYKKGDLKKAEEYFLKVIDANKSVESAYLALSNIYETEGDKQAAVEILNKALENMPQNKNIIKRLNNIKEGKKELSYVLYFSI